MAPPADLDLRAFWLQNKFWNLYHDADKGFSSDNSIGVPVVSISVWVERLLQRGGMLLNETWSHRIERGETSRRDLATKGKPEVACGLVVTYLDSMAAATNPIKPTWMGAMTGHRALLLQWYTLAAARHK